MEIHSHTHTPRKKWRHYFWEFLMLFLAVFCGFLAENWREHIVEHQREKQFIRSLYSDLKTDTSNLTRIVYTRTIREQSLDSLSYMMNSPHPENYLKQIYAHAVYASRTLLYRFVPNDGTILQLINSGAFRLIRNRMVADSISQYNISVRNFLGQYAVEENQIEHYRDAASKIFNALVFNKMIDENAAVIRQPEGDLRLQPFTDRELYEWNYRIYGVIGINKANRRELRDILQQATALLDLLKKEYHLK